MTVGRPLMSALVALLALASVAIVCALGVLMPASHSGTAGVRSHAIASAAANGPDNTVWE